jgi:hypothetical protein
MSFRLAPAPNQPPMRWVPAVKWLGHEADHLPPTSAEVFVLCLINLEQEYLYLLPIGV